MEGKRFVQSLRLRGFLSYGLATPEVALEPLNVLIGLNASGKSNFVEGLSLLKAAPVDLVAPIREGGGIREWIWKGEDYRGGAEIDATLYYPEGLMPLRHVLCLDEVGQRLAVRDERIEEPRPRSRGRSDPYFFYQYRNGHPALYARAPIDAETRAVQPPASGSVREIGDEYGSQGYRRALKRETIDPAQSILAQKKDVDLYPELTYLGDQYRQIRVYREWSFGRNAPPGDPSRPICLTTSCSRMPATLPWSSIT